MAKYSKKLVNKICNLIKSDSYTIPEICRLSGISESVFHLWKKTKVEFLEAVGQAQDERKEIFAVEAKKSLLKKIQGYTFIEKKTITIPYGENDETGKPKPKIKEQTVTEKHIAPDTTAIIFTLTNTDSENWKNKINNEVTGKDGKDLIQSVDLSKLSDSELSEYHKLIQKASGK